MTHKQNTDFLPQTEMVDKGSDDIYKFKENIPLEYKCEQTLSIAVIDQETREVIPNAQVTFLDENMQAIEQVFADENGKYTFEKAKWNVIKTTRFV